MSAPKRRTHREDTWIPSKEIQTAKERLEIRAQNQIDRLEKEVQEEKALFWGRLAVTFPIVVIPVALFGGFKGVELGQVIFGPCMGPLFGTLGVFIAIILLFLLAMGTGTFYERSVSKSLEVKKNRFKLFYDPRMSKLSQSLLQESF